MILIADSGSTKTAWRILDEDKEISQAFTAGINPYLQSPDTMVSTIRDSLLPQLEIIPEKIYFYGAGCSSEINKRGVGKVLQEVFPKADIKVDHDLMAAARSLCGDERGIACILGTGANACLYDGNRIIDNIPALGYILGDEGSGSHLGKRLLADYFRKEMPKEIHDKMSDRFELSINHVLTQVYKEEMATQYLASFSKFVFQNIKEPYLYQLVYDSFKTFVDKNIVKFDNYKGEKIHFSGSVAFYYSNILRQVGNDTGLTIKNIVENPISGLTLYHQKINML